MQSLMWEKEINVREGNQVATNQVEDGLPKMNRFYALQSKGDQVWSHYVPLRYLFLEWFMKTTRISMIMIFFADFSVLNDDELKLEIHVWLISKWAGG